MSALKEYVDAWVDNDVDRIAAAVTDDCVITECHGPVYRGRDCVRRWARTWFEAGGVVHDWVLTDHFAAADRREVAERTFECTWNGDRTTFDGATVAHISDGLIRELRES